jgi:charged multivesicular body protein 5
MNRIFGNKNKTPAPTLTDQCDTIDSRISTVDKKIAMLDAELLKYKTQMSKVRPGPTKKQIQQKALRVLKQKKMLESQRENMANTSFNMDQTNFAIQNMKDTQVTVSAMKAGMKEMKKETKKLNIGKIENMQDEMEDMMMDSEKIMGIMGRSYGIGNDIDEDELEAELDALGDDLFDEDSSYLDAVDNQSVNLPSIPGNKIGENNRPVAEIDEFGLPVVN